ncbi:PLD nuclease N-terminal domain-containing protein [Reichenbachiella sp. MALMAid0571]
MSMILVLIAAAFVIWALIDIFKSRMETSNKVLWFAVVILFPLVGSVLYYFVARDK